MDTLEKLQTDLQNALTHLYDRDYESTPLLYAATGCSARNGPASIQSAIIREIEDLTPPASLPANAHTRRVHDVLYYRYVQKLTLAETAELSNLSIRHLTRVQRDAVHTLASILWERVQAQETPRPHRNNELNLTKDYPATQASDWHSQARREIASVRANAPDAVSDVGKTLAGVLKLMRHTLSDRNVEAKVEFVQPGLVATVHPSVLRQILIAALARLAQYCHGEQISIYAGLEAGNVKITAVSTITSTHKPTATELVDGIVLPENVSATAHVENDHIFLGIETPSVGKLNVLVVDDNPDMVRFYQRATLGTVYRIVQAAQGPDLLRTVESCSPNVILLDVMLPDVDGWELLTTLHENPTTRPIPVIICSVVREEILALSLGATLYLPKPVRPRELIRALDQVLSPASTEVQPSPANSAATD